MRVMNHNWSDRKQCIHLQTAAVISRHATLSEDRIWQCGTLSESYRKDKRFSRDHCCWGRSKPGYGIVGSHTRWELTTLSDFQLCLHRLLMSAGCKSSHSGFLDVSRRNGGLKISGCIGQLSCLTISPSACHWQRSSRRRFWHATHDCVAPYVKTTSSSTEGGSEPNLLLRGA